MRMDRSKIRNPYPKKSTWKQKPEIIWANKNKRQPIIVLSERGLPLACDCDIRPCPYYTCRYHMKFDITEKGSLRDNHPGREYWEMDDTCVLDVAKRGPLSLEDVGKALNLTRERVRQLEREAIDKLRPLVCDNPELIALFLALDD